MVPISLSVATRRLPFLICAEVMRFFRSDDVVNAEMPLLFCADVVSLFRIVVTTHSYPVPFNL